MQLATKRWGRHFNADLVDYRVMLANWAATRPAEKQAGSIVAALRSKCEAALEFIDATPREHGGHKTTALHAVQDELRQILETLDHGDDADHVPSIRPGLREWYVGRNIGALFAGATTRELAVLSLIAGFWPPRMVAGTVARVLTEQDKAVRSMLQKYNAFLNAPIFKSL